MRMLAHTHMGYPLRVWANIMSHTRMGVPYEYACMIIRSYTTCTPGVNFGLCDSCNMGTSDLPDMYAQSPRAAGPRAEGIHTRQITSAHVTIIM